MKRYFKGIVAVLSVMALLVGCSGGQTDDGTTTAQSSP